MGVFNFSNMQDTNEQSKENLYIPVEFRQDNNNVASDNNYAGINNKKAASSNGYLPGGSNGFIDETGTWNDGSSLYQYKTTETQWNQSIAGQLVNSTAYKKYFYNREDVPFNYRENIRRGGIVRDFLFERGTVTVRADGNFVKNRPDFEMECLGLPDARLDEILSGNFLRFMGGAPKAAEKELILQECAFMKEESLRAELHGIAADTRGLELAVKYLR